MRIVILHMLFISTINRYIQTMNNDQQYLTIPFEIIPQQYEINSFFAYGIWTRYLPLSTYQQMRETGIFDSNCFNIHNAYDVINNEINFLYYDCIKSNKITKNIQFINDEGVSYQFQIIIENDKYENQWFYFELSQWPINRRLELIIIQSQTLSFHEILDIQYPYQSKNLILRFGGDLMKNDNLLLSDEQFFSYFPGKILLYPLTIDQMEFQADPLSIIIDEFQFQYDCFCDNALNQVSNIDLTQLQTYIKISDGQYCDQYSLNGWIQVIEYFKKSENFTYLFFKMCGNSENIIIQNQNLCALQLLFFISNNIKKIIVTTYNYLIPLINQNYTQNQNLKSYEFEVINIQQWFYLQVVFIQNNYTIQINYQENDEVIKQKFNLFVNHFHQVQFKFVYGNIYQLIDNYIQIKIYNFIYNNCYIFHKINICHMSCLTCDGPTKNNCLSCDINSYRIYQKDKKACICPYGFIDNQICSNYKDFNFDIVQYNSKQIQKCRFGYFEFYDNCIQCPSVIKTHVMTCIECIQNPSQWINNLQCSNYIALDQIGSPYKIIYEENSYYIYDGLYINLCEDCNSNNNLENNYNNFLIKNIYFQEFCQYSNSENYSLQYSKNQCYNCSGIQYCIRCKIIQTGLYCLQCLYFTELLDGKCILGQLTGYININKCQSPYYINSNKGCSFCLIKNCKYCFEYLQNDLNFNTLQKNFIAFDLDENHQIGCALCVSQYIFDFTQGECIKINSQLKNCSRSYINLIGQEVCTLSSIFDFTIAPEILYCQNYISHCQQCILTPQQQIKCIICEDGYSASINFGQCNICRIDNAKICIEGSYLQMDGWVQLIQSFMMQFLPNQYFYPRTTALYQIVQQAITCKNGYVVNKRGICVADCDDLCQKCEQLESNNYMSQCQYCGINIYDQPIRSSFNGICLICTQLCEICVVRNDDEIKLLNPQFIINEENKIYTYKCLKTVTNIDKISYQFQIDPYLSIVNYCFDENCLDFINFNVLISCDNFYIITLSYLGYYYQDQINIQYCNQIGIKKLQITFNVTQLQENCWYGYPTEITNNLKQQIFTLQEIYFRAIGIQFLQSIIYDSLIIINFDHIEFSNLNFASPQNNFILKFINLQNLLSTLKFQNLTFTSQQIQQNFTISSQNIHIQNFQSINISFINLIIYDSITFNLNAQNIQIINLKIENCTFQNVIILNIKNSTQISVQTFQVQNSKLLNSSIFTIQRNKQISQLLIFDSIQIENSSFFNSSIIFNIEQFITSIPDILVQNLLMNQNQIYNSQLFQTNKNISFNYVQIKLNKFQKSKFYISSDEFFADNINLKFNNFIVYQNELTMSSIISAISNQIQQIQIKNFHYNETKSLIHSSEYLFIIKCMSLYVDNFNMFENFNIQIFYLNQVSYALFNEIIILNSKPESQVYFSYDCYPIKLYNSIIIHISGFKKLLINNILIIQQLSFDQSLIQIISDTPFNSIDNEIIQIENFTINQCILLKKNIANLFSLIAIYSEKSQLIIFQNLTFIQNTFHQYIDDPSSSSSGLIYIESLQSEVTIDQIYSQQNHLTNSTNSFITIYSKVIDIQKITIINHNFDFDTSWQNIYQFQYKILEDDNIFSLIESIFIIQNIGGAFSITASIFTLKNSQFINITAQSSAILELKTQGVGNVLLNQLYFNNISSDLSQFVDLNGCINIYSKNSLLNLQLIEISFNNILNNLGSAILSIIPSQKYNFIKFQNIQIFNCLSLTNTLTKIEFAENKQIINYVQMQNVTIKISLIGNINFFHQLNTISIDDVNKIKIDSGFINLKNCNFHVKNFTVEGVLLIPIMKLQDISNLIFNQFYIDSVQQFYPFQLLNIYQQKSTIKQSIISNLKIQNLRLISLDDQIPQINLKKFVFSFFECKIEYKFLSLNNTNDGLMKIFVEQFKKDVKTAIPFLYFFSNSVSIKILIQNVEFLQNQFLEDYQKQFPQNSYNGISLQIENFKYLKINELSCNQNIFYLNGCIIFQSQNIQKQKSIILIQQSIFISNEGGMGVGIYSNNHNLVLKNCKFLKNKSTGDGGAIYFNSSDQRIELRDTFIFNNSAINGGGIYLCGNNHFNDKNFIKSMLQFNTASLSANNLNEQPRFLQLSINNLKVNSISIEINNTYSQQPQIQNYSFLEQGKIRKTNFLFFPSNQQVIHYQIFNPKTEKFLNYIDELSLSFRNTFGELIFVNNNNFCNIQQNIISNQEIEKIIIFETIFLNSLIYKINLGAYKMKFDPYYTLEKISQLQVVCPTDNNTNNLIYKINFKSFMCQLGEFYINEGCEICQATQGFYSVTYNVTKCSIFDKTKFKSITSNRIELLQGYWRPDPLSDNIEECFKNKNFCQGGWETNDKLCILGHIGGLCEECDIYNIQGQGQFFKTQQDQNCRFCFQFDTGVISSILALIWSLLSIILTLRSVEKSNNLYTSLRLRQKQYKILFQLNQDHESILIKMLINYVWIFSVILTFNIDYRISLNIADSTANTIQFMINNLNCYLVDITQITIIYFKVIFMIVLIIMELLFIICIYFLISKIRAIKFELSIISTTAIYLFVSNHASLIKNFCSLISRRKISEIYFIQGDVSYLYNTNSHNKWIFGFILPGIGVCGLLIPILLFLSIYIQRKKLDQIKRRKFICYLFNEYNQSSYFWEQIKIWQKTIIIIILTQFETDILLKVSLLGICLLLYQILASKFRPYNIKNLNKMDVESGQICTFAVFLAAITYGSEKYNTQYSFILQAFLMLLFIRLCVPFLHDAFRVYYKKYKIFLISKIIEIFKKLRLSSSIIYILSEKLNSWKEKQILLKNNIEKLRRYLITISKVQEQQKIPSSSNTPMSTFRSKQNSHESEFKKIIRDYD